MRNSLIALWLALSLYTAAFIAEIVRAGIMAVSKGQSEAAYALGLRPGRTMSLVILPQALARDHSTADFAIPQSYQELLSRDRGRVHGRDRTLGGITLNQTGRELESILLLMACYLAISLSVSAVLNWYNESVKLIER